MAKRFFKLLYVIALIGIVVSLPVVILTSVRFDWITVTSYKAKCNSNNEYVVLEGSSLNSPYVFDEVTLNDTTFSDTKKDLNFYCQYYDEIQPYIIGYAESDTRVEQVLTNQRFFKFEESVSSNVWSYPPQYTLEIVSNETNWYELWGPVLGWLIYATLSFLFLQIIRICYTYVVFGKLVWHPFKSIKT
ncbi:MAG: hypothetical protein KBF62_01850 [Candidatus Pacebacteria bacterium]|nr:hypothetical protein [Candidatus Paceibacterota bacterium]MBP9058363.1 hypothetical protein [Candidatus Paceibacterota bacterium]MBP9770079.1 hypothetical protein [Candidatus Paceibacterota bacterium]